MIHMREINSENLVKTLVRKMAPPLVTLLSNPPEVQWVALRNINLLLQKRPDMLSNEMRVFFCKYNDPLYVKVEKLDIMVRLASENNVDPLLSELKEYAVCHKYTHIESDALTWAALNRYAQEVDVDFVRRSIKAIGQTAIKIDEAAERCVNVLLELIDTRVSYVVQEAVVVMKVRCVADLFAFLVVCAAKGMDLPTSFAFATGYIPEISINIRRRHPDTMREP